eukprot:3769863-Prymnesium_polylepis.1
MNESPIRRRRGARRSEVSVLSSSFASLTSTLCRSSQPRRCQPDADHAVRGVAIVACSGERCNLENITKGCCIRQAIRRRRPIRLTAAAWLTPVPLRPLPLCTGQPCAKNLGAARPPAGAEHVGTDQGLGTHAKRAGEVGGRRYNYCQHTRLPGRL